MLTRFGKSSLFIALFLLVALISSACGSGSSDGYHNRLDRIVKVIGDALRRVDQTTATATEIIGNTGLDSAETRLTLMEICSAEGAAIDCSTINTNGVLVAVEPSEYSSAEGADISEQEQWKRLRDSQQPVLSLLFKAVEGMWALDFEHPINDRSGLWQGSVSMLIDHVRLVNDALTSLSPDDRYQIMLMQVDGTILYDSDPEQIGRNTFTDPIYADFTSLLALAQQVVDEPVGTGSYQFSAIDSGEIITKDAIWRTVELHGTQWRVVLIRPQVDA